MSWNINRVLLIGRLSKDPELKYTPSGAAVANFGLAVGGKPKPDGTDSVSFFNVVVWGKVAENCGTYLTKGKLICVDGRLEQRTWTDQNGGKRSAVDVVAERVEFLTPISGGNRTQPANDGGDGDFYDNTNFDSGTEPGDNF